jgi:acetyl-CoA carboxylase biotin carboxyl carrier protein
MSDGGAGPVPGESGMAVPDVTAVDATAIPDLTAVDAPAFPAVTAVDATGAESHPAGRSVTRDPGTGEILDLIDRLEDLLDHSDLAELEVQAGDFGLVLRKPTLFASPPASDAGVGAGTSPEPDLHVPVVPAEPEVKLHRVLAPLTGIWYLTSSPDAAPYVRVGQEVVKGQVIGLIEAMKLFNEIKSDAGGRVAGILAEPGALVKQKQPLIEIEPA